MSDDLDRRSKANEMAGEELVTMMENTFGKAILEADSPEKALAASLQEADRIPHSRDEVLRAIAELSEGGRNLVFVGGPHYRDNFVFHLMRARTQQVGDRVSLFIVPFAEFRKFIELLPALRASVSPPSPETLVAKVRRKLPIGRQETE